MVVAGSLYGLARGLFLRSRQVVFLLIWLAAVLLYLLIPSLQTRYLYMLWPALLMLAAWGLAQAAHDLSRRFWGANRTGLPLVAGATLIVVLIGAGANVRLAPYQTLYANALAAWLWEKPVLLSDHDLYAVGAEKALLDYLNATAEADSIIGTLLPLRPTAPLSVYAYYGRDDLTYVDLHGLDGGECLRDVTPHGLSAHPTHQGASPIAGVAPSDRPRLSQAVCNPFARHCHWRYLKAPEFYAKFISC